MRFVGVVLLPVLAALGCSHAAVREAAAPTCPAGTSIVVGPGVRPAISWTGDCRVMLVRVYRSSPPRTDRLEVPIWQVFSAAGELRSPVRVGQTPADLFGTEQDVSLPPGELHRVCLWALTPATRAVIDLGCKSFTP